MNRFSWNLSHHTTVENISATVLVPSMSVLFASTTYLCYCSFKVTVLMPSMRVFVRAPVCSMLAPCGLRSTLLGPVRMKALNDTRAVILMVNSGKTCNKNKFSPLSSDTENNEFPSWLTTATLSKMTATEKTQNVNTRTFDLCRKEFFQPDLRYVCCCQRSAFDADVRHGR